jgi:hypothetical protein
MRDVDERRVDRGAVRSRNGGGKPPPLTGIVACQRRDRRSIDPVEGRPNGLRTLARDHILGVQLIHS